MTLRERAIAAHCDAQAAARRKAEEARHTQFKIDSADFRVALGKLLDVPADTIAVDPSSIDGPHLAALVEGIRFGFERHEADFGAVKIFAVRPCDLCGGEACCSGFLQSLGDLGAWLEQQDAIPSAVCELCGTTSPVSTEGRAVPRYPIAARVTSIEGEQGHDGNDQPRSTGPNAKGLIADVLPQQENCYLVSFWETGVEVFLSDSDLADISRYRVEVS